MSQPEKCRGVQDMMMALESVSQTVLQITDDIELLYQRPELGRSKFRGIPVSPELVRNVASLQPGKVLVIATRNFRLRESFCLELVRHLALRCKQRLFLYGMDRPMLNFLRSLIDLMSGISSDASIYDGRLAEEEFSRLSAVLNELGKSQVFVGQGKYAELDTLCDTVMKHEVKRGEGGLVLVDNVQLIHGGTCRVDTLAVLGRLKELVAGIEPPVIALYHLDDTVRLPEFILTRHELALMERAAAKADRVMLMGGTPGNLLFQPPKIPR